MTYLFGASHRIRNFRGAFGLRDFRRAKKPAIPCDGEALRGSQLSNTRLNDVWLQVRVTVSLLSNGLCTGFHHGRRCLIRRETSSAQSFPFPSPFPRGLLLLPRGFEGCQETIFSRTTKNRPQSNRPRALSWERMIDSCNLAFAKAPRLRSGLPLRSFSTRLSAAANRRSAASRSATA